tara:strand:- start:140 stop:574 length:435 start_codon:yes stop_codon:yes gene_type:complete
LIFIFIVGLQTGFTHDGNPHVIPGQSKADSQDACVEPTNVMRKEHYLFLLHQRDDTVIDGIRTKNHSLANCIDCHVSYDEKGTAIPINSKGQFCQDCHEKTATNITCFSCHAAEPRYPNHSTKLNAKDLEEIQDIAQHIEENVK